MLIVRGADIVTMDRDRSVITGGSVAIDGARIVEVGSTTAMAERHPDAEVLAAEGCVVTPGLINAHHHLTGGPLVRSCIPDLLAPGVSIFEWTIPVHGAHSPEDDEVSAAIAAVDCIRNGVTTVVEAGTVAHVERVAAGVTAVGLRATLGVWGWDIEEGPHTGPTDEVLSRQRAAIEACAGHALVSGWVTLVGHDLASDELLAGAADLARDLGTNMTMHMSPTSSDPEQYLARTGRRPLVHLHHLGVLGPHLLIAHGVWLDDDEVDLVIETDTAIAYCPWAYLRLGQGVCAHGRHHEIHERGGRIALGCDAANAGDMTDILRTAALAAGLARDKAIDPTRFGAHDALELATIRGAAAIGMADVIGSIEVGKLADLVVHSAADWGWRLGGDVGLELVWGTDGRSVRDVIVDGTIVMRDRSILTIDAAELEERAQTCSRSLLERAGLDVPSRWPSVDGR